MRLKVSRYSSPHFVARYFFESSKLHFGYETMSDQEAEFFLCAVYWHVGSVGDSGQRAQSFSGDYLDYVSVNVVFCSSPFIRQTLALSELDYYWMLNSLILVVVNKSGNVVCWLVLMFE